MASKKEILKACPLSIDQIFSVYEAYNTHLHKDQPHLIHTTLKYRSAETGKLVFVLVHALIDEGDIEIFESTPVEARP